MNITEELAGLNIHATNVMDMLMDETPISHEHGCFINDAINIIGEMVKELRELEGHKQSIGESLKSQIKSAHYALHGGQR